MSDTIPTYRLIDEIKSTYLDETLSSPESSWQKDVKVLYNLIQRNPFDTDLEIGAACEECGIGDNNISIYFQARRGLVSPGLRPGASRGAGQGAAKAYGGQRVARSAHGGVRRSEQLLADVQAQDGTDADGVSQAASRKMKRKNPQKNVMFFLFPL